MKRYDHLLEQVNSKFILSDRIRKCQEELLELGVALGRVIDGRGSKENVSEEMADVLLTIRSVELVLGLDDISHWLKLKSDILHRRLLEGNL
jgi:NTP pyrophosphatase (non-canonical NTP hydrolase)